MAYLTDAGVKVGVLVGSNAVANIAAGALILVAKPVFTKHRIVVQSHRRQKSVIGPTGYL